MDDLLCFPEPHTLMALLFFSWWRGIEVQTSPSFWKAWRAQVSASEVDTARVGGSPSRDTERPMCNDTDMHARTPVSGYRSSGGSLKGSAQGYGCSFCSLPEHCPQGLGTAS